MWLRPFNRNGGGEPWASGYKLGETLCSKPIEWGVWRAILDTGKSVPPWRTQPIRSSGDRQCNQKYKTTVYAKCISYLFCILSKPLPNFAKLIILASSMLISKWGPLVSHQGLPNNPQHQGTQCWPCPEKSALATVCCAKLVGFMLPLGVWELVVNGSLSDSQRNHVLYTQLQFRIKV